MNWLLLSAAGLLASIPSVSAQIHADFVVSHGGVPLGTFRARLDFDKAPRPCANFIGLATGARPWLDANGAIRHQTPFYNGVKFHRLVHNFVIQAGARDGTDGPGYTFLDQYHPDLRHSGRYILSMAKAGRPNTNGSQFFITLNPTPDLDDKHSVFGEIISGREIIDGFTNPTAFPVNAQSQPLTPIVIESVTISGPDLAGFNIDDPALRLPHIVNVPLTGVRDAAASNFRLAFDRTLRTSYQIFDSVDLVNWSTLKYVLSNEPVAGSTFTIGVNAPRYFTRVAGVSYADVTNAPSNLIHAGKQLVLTNRAGYQVTLTFDGAGGGTWNDGSASGTLSSVVWNDFIPATGGAGADVPIAHEYALGYLGMNLSSPGPDGITRLDTFVSFHTPSTGFLEEAVSTVPANRFRFAFQWTP